MKQKIFSILLVGACLFFFGCSEDGLMGPDASMDDDALKGAKKPIPHLVGQQECTFFPDFTYDCTMDFGEWGKYGIAFIPHGPPRDFSQASIFEEDVIIYQLGTDWTNMDNVVLMGLIRGTHTLANQPPDPTKFVTRGKVTYATGPLEMWEGCTMHQHGTFYWTPEMGPSHIEGTLRIN